MTLRRSLRMFRNQEAVEGRSTEISEEIMKSFSLRITPRVWLSGRRNVVHCWIGALTIREYCRCIELWSASS